MGGRYSIIRLNDWSDRCWGVVNGKGALVHNDGLALRMTKDEAQALAERLNVEAAGNISAIAAPRPAAAD